MAWGGGGGGDGEMIMVMGMCTNQHRYSSGNTYIAGRGRGYIWGRGYLGGGELRRGSRGVQGGGGGGT